MELFAGKLRMMYDHGFLRYIKVENYEVLRMIYFALRDHNWDTMSGRIEDEVIEKNVDSFLITYRWISTNTKFPFEWAVRIEGSPDSEIQFVIDGAAGADVRKNRSGFCILHSVPENAGGPCVIIDPQGHSSENNFPRLIRPHQPFFNIAGMRWPLGNLGEASLQFEGDVFETEDQRNWSDDSYKTYCTPLKIPFPALLVKGESVHQVVELKVHLNEDVRTMPAAAGPVVLTPASFRLPKPAIGISAPQSGFLSGSDLELLRKLAFDHYRVEVHFDDPRWQEHLDQRMREALALNLQVEMWLIFKDSGIESAIQLSNYLEQVPAELRLLLLILHRDHKTTPEGLLKAVIPYFRNLNKSIQIGAGTAAYFTEINRERVHCEDLDFVSYSVNPQVHAFDDLSLVENAYAQAYTVESCRHYFPGKKVHVSPVTLKPRFNPNATADEGASGGELPDTVDVRQKSLFAAGWTIGSVLSLVEAGADRVTYFEATGWRGVMQGSEKSPMPERFAAQPGTLFPVFHLFNCLASHKGADWLPFRSSDPFRIVAIGFREKTRCFFLIANLKNHAAEVTLKYPCSKYKLFQFDANNLTDSYFNEQFLTKNLEESPVNSGPVSSITIAAHAIVYAELQD